MRKGFIVFSLKNKTALVTGGASGIGAAIAAAFAEAGAMVWIVDRNEIEGSATAEQVGGKFLALDVSSETECGRAAQTVGPLDVLANVAGIGHVGTLANTAAADLDRLYAVNVRGVFNCCKAFALPMVERKAGSVINMASIAGIVAVRERLAYTTAKFAVVGLTKALALGSFAHGRAVQLHLPRTRGDGVCACAPEGVSRPGKGVPRHGVNAAHGPDGAAGGDRGGGVVSGGGRIGDGHGQRADDRRGLERGKVIL